MIRLVVDIAKTVWDHNIHSFKDPGVSVRECPESFRAASKMGILQLRLDSSKNGGHGWHKCWSRASYSACHRSGRVQNRASYSACHRSGRVQNSSLSDRFTFDQVGILGIPHNLARQVLEHARRRASQASVNDFESLTLWVSTGVRRS